MVRILHKIIAVAMVLLLMAGSGFLAFTAVGSSEDWNSFLQTCAVEQFVVFCVAVALFILGILFVLTAIRPRTKDRYVSYAGEGGRVSVSLRGIGTFVTKISREFDGVKGLKARVAAGNGWIDVILDAKIREGDQVHEICEAMQQRVRDRLKESLGLTEIRNVTVNVREILSQHGWDKEQ